MTGLRVHPLHVGTITRQIAGFCRGIEPRIVDLPLISWYIEGSDMRILVDTGAGDPVEMPRQVHPYRREKTQTLEAGLRRLEVGCDDIDIVVATHLHWDHSGGNHLFPNARVIVQSEEIKNAAIFAPGIPMPPGYMADVKYTEVSGDSQIARGVKVILTPGHTFGLQAVLVEGESRRFLIASDTLPLFKNLESKPPAISGIYVDLEQYHASIKKILNLSAFVLPSHDFRVLEQEVYS